MAYLTFPLHSWDHWLNGMEPFLTRGKKALVPPELGHPAEAGFTPFFWSDYVGQVRDWGLPTTDGGRFHIHEMPNGQFVVHKDKTDPGRGVQATVQHVMEESQAGPLVALGLAYGVYRHLSHKPRRR